MGRVALIDALESWYGSRRSSLESKAFDTNLHRGPEAPVGDKSLARVDVDGPSRLGSVTLWDTGEAEVSVIEYPSEEEVLTVSLTLRTASELHETMEKFVTAVTG